MSSRTRLASSRAVPTEPSPPATDTAALSSAFVHGPNEPWTIGTSTPSTSHAGVRIIRSESYKRRIASPVETLPGSMTWAFTPRSRSSRPSGELMNLSASLPNRAENFAQPVCGT